MELLPEECIVHLLSLVSPQDACRSSVVSSVFRNAVESELLWDKLLPPDHQEILSRMVSPLTFNSKKELFFKLSSPLLVDGGHKTFSIDKATGRKCYMLSARELCMTWSGNPQFQCWKRLPQSRFPEAVELRAVSWHFEIQGKINTQILSPDTSYGAYLVLHVSHDHDFGSDNLSTEVSIEVGELHTRRTINFSHKKCGWVFHERKDGWLEIELGEFYNNGICEKEVKMSLMELGEFYTGELLVEGIEVRPKHFVW